MGRPRSIPTYVLDPIQEKKKKNSQIKTHIPVGLTQIKTHIYPPQPHQHHFCSSISNGVGNCLINTHT